MTNTAATHPGSSDTPMITNIRRHAGIAGQYAYSAMVQYGNEGPERITFVAYHDSAVVVMVTESGAQVFVSREVIERLGSKVNQEWIRGFFA